MSGSEASQLADHWVKEISSIAGIGIFLREREREREMAEGGPPGPAPPREEPPLQPIPQPPQPGQQEQMHMNWSHFKPEYSGKPEEDVEAHWLRTNDWINTHDFPDGVKVQRFCLTLMGEARIWYAPLEPVAMTWPELQISLEDSILS